MDINTKTLTLIGRNEGELRTKIFSHILHNIVPPPEGGRLLDLGAGPCIFAKRARDAGYQVTAVDARTERIPSPEDLGTIRFIQSDVRQFDVAGYDAIAILGLFYHLELADQINLLKKCNYGAVVIIDTQIHDPGIILGAAMSWGTASQRLGRYEGVQYPEGSNPMASVGNNTSFWHTEASLLRLIEDCGFSNVLVLNPMYTSKYGARKFYVLNVPRT